MLTALVVALHAVPAAAQEPVTRHAGSDSVMATAGTRYGAGWINRFLLGTTYRNLWTTPIRVPVLDLRRFAGGLTPSKTGGGNQTRSLRFVSQDGTEYVFRLVDKENSSVPAGFEQTIVHSIARDQVSAHHPAGAVVTAPLLQAAGVLHPTPVLALMPDDSLLGEFRKEFAGALGSIEVFPTEPAEAPRFAGAAGIIDSDSLRRLLEKDPRLRIDARAYLTARLMDAMLGDWDRHAGNWKWARMRSTPETPWVPIARDRDKAFITYGGIVAAAGKFAPNLMTYEAVYPPVRGLTWNSLELDRRLLVGVEKPVWDSVAGTLQHRITDRIIDAAVAGMPGEYRHSAPSLAAKLKQRRDRLPEHAGRFYRYLAAGPDIHATDAADRATIHRMDDGSVDVRLQSGNDAPWFRRRFHPSETDEIRLYLHGGDDRAVVTGTVSRSMPVRIIGGNGTNELIDSSTVGGRAARARFYDAGTVTDVEYGTDTLFNRRPWVRADGGRVAPGRDRGSTAGPVIGVSAPGDVGLVFRAGWRQTRYGFRTRPYAANTILTAEYATGVSGWRLTGFADRRREGTPLHITARARMSELEVINFHGLGNDTPDDTAGTAAGFYQVRHRQWLFQPALALAVGTRSDLTFGPVVQFSTTDQARGSFISTVRPYGFGDFGQAGLRLGLYLDERDQARDPRNGILLDLGATWFPGIWDVESAFGAVSAAAAYYHTLPVPLRPVLVLRASAKKLFGDFPYHESAFVGGRGSVRVLDLQRYAGDALFGGTTELQIPLGTVPLVLPFDIGVYGFADAGRVYLDGASPGGWHTGTGVGFWVGILNPSTALTVELGRHRGRSLTRIKTGLNF
jgi:hypothetical protein